MTSSGSVSAFAGFRFPREVISVAVRWYLRYGLSYRDVEELLAERGVDVDHVTIYRWVQRFTRSSSRPPGRAATALVTGGSSTRPTSRSPAGGRTCTGRSTSTARSSTSGCPAGVTCRGTGVLQPGTRLGDGAGRGHHRPGAGLPAGPRRVGPIGPAHHGAVCEQRGLRPTMADSKPASTDARSQAIPVGSHPCRWSCFVQNLRRGHYEIAVDQPAETVFAPPSMSWCLPSD